MRGSEKVFALNVVSKSNSFVLKSAGELDALCNENAPTLFHHIQLMAATVVSLMRTSAAMRKCILTNSLCFYCAKQPPTSTDTMR